jgi:Skp family chaperone for outer membrane proteins
MTTTHSMISRVLRPEFLLVALFAALFGAYTLRHDARGYDTRGAAAEATPSRVGTIDLEKTFNSIERYTAAQAKIKTLAEDLEKQVKTADAKVRDLQSELDSFQAGSDAQAAAIAKLQAAVGELRAIQQYVGAKREVEAARALRDTYLAIKDAARRFAEKEGYDYIMLDDSVPEMDPANAQKTMAQISARRFIFASNKRDVTMQLVGMMNEEWKAGKGG